MRSTSRSAAAVLTLGLAATLTLTACGSDSGSTGSGDSGGSNNELAFIQGVAGDQFYITMECGVKAEAEKLGMEVDVQGPQKFDPTLQKPIVDSVVASKPAAMLIAPTDTSAMEAPLKQAASAGIKVGLVDTTVNDPSFAVTQVSSDNEGGGAEAFKAIKELNPSGGKVLVISTDPGVSTTDARTKGFEDAAKADSAFTYLGVQYSHNDPSTAAKIITAALSKDPDIVGVFATNLFSAAGTSTGVKQAGKAEQVKIVGFDAGPDQISALKDGTVQALIAQDPYQIGVDGVQQVSAALKGESTTKEIQTGFHVITADNVDGEGAQYAYKSSC
ncbi:ABC transporter substrate-binding protein [Kineococcus gynurae]|uniref:ABC transporter substrate-binding protein n=1 Tax=Kineococcus gynurae TaxID=452979 RepID=A0ABV5LMP8_9ACTN